MTKVLKKRKKRAGLPPGSMVYVGDRKNEPTRISVFQYNQEGIQEIQTIKVEELEPISKQPLHVWVNVDGIHNVDVIEKIGKTFDLHPLTLEDIVNTHQRPKCETYNNYIYLVLKTIYMNPNRNELEAEQISIVIGPNYILSFQEKPGDTFDVIRDRLRTDKGRIRKSGPDYLAYTLLDSIVDHYFVILELLGERIEEIEKNALGLATKGCLVDIQVMKKDLLFMRRSIWPLRIIVSELEKQEKDGSPLIHASTRLYLRDVYDHTIQLIETTETMRDLLANILEIYFSSVNLRLNEVLKFLAVISTIFMPLTFIAGVYGMNFKYMPELEWVWGYPLILAVMTLITTYMLFFFYKKKWL